ncbi:MAG TPA: response regulator transcription factor [Rubrobacteraceae bacterium]|nr:response regulator transcription factor [Rubrobacteraceae bacterium]
MQADEILKKTLTQVECATDKCDVFDLLWIKCESPSVMILGLTLALEETATQVHTGLSHPEMAPSSIMLLANNASSVSEVSEDVEVLQELYPDSIILVFGVHPDVSLAKVAIKCGARGFVHAGMSPQQIARAMEVAAEGELVLPRALLEDFILSEEQVGLGVLSARQREILNLLAEGMSNAEIGDRLHLAESTVKQHLRTSYKILGVSSRIEAAGLVRT